MVTRPLSYLAIFGLLAGGPLPASAQLSDVEARLIALLESAPLAGTPGDSIGSREFIVQAAAILRQLPGDDRPGTVIRSVNDAVRELEAELAKFGLVTVRVLSIPPGARIAFRHAVDPPSKNLPSVTTNDTLLVLPGWIDFSWTNERTGKTFRQRASCATNCTVMFNMFADSMAATSESSGWPSRAEQ